MTTVKESAPVRPDVPRETEMFAEEVVRFIDKYVERLKQIRSSVDDIVWGEDYPRDLNVLQARLRTCRHEERIARSGAEQLARYVSQEIEQGGLPRHLEVKLGTLLAELESAITSIQEYVQEAKTLSPAPVKAASTADTFNPPSPFDIDGDDVPF